MKTLVKSQFFKETALFLALLGGAMILSTVFSPDVAFAASQDDNIGFVSNLTNGEGDLRSLVKTILNYFLSFLAFVTVIMLVYAGILYTTSAGSEEKTGQAKKIIMYALMGIIIIMVSFAVVNTIFQAGQGTGVIT
jgi:MFS-type transporter involved in bile tolerance (Atg22 family)